MVLPLLRCALPCCDRLRKPCANRKMLITNNKSALLRRKKRKSRKLRKLRKLGANEPSRSTLAEFELLLVDFQGFDSSRESGLWNSKLSRRSRRAGNPTPTLS